MPGNTNPNFTPVLTEPVSVPAQPTRVVVLVSSIGVAEALAQVIGAFGRDCKTAFIAFPDVRRGFCNILCDKIRAECSIPASELRSTQPLRSGELIVVPSQCRIEISVDSSGQPLASSVTVNEQSSDYSARITQSVVSITAQFGASVAAVMLSSMAGDQVEAMAQVKKADGVVICQSEATSLLADGVRAVQERQIENTVLPLWAIGGHISEIMESWL